MYRKGDYGKVKRLECIADWCVGFSHYFPIREEFYHLHHMLNQMSNIAEQMKGIPKWMWPIQAIITAELQMIIESEFGEEAWLTIERYK